MKILSALAAALGVVFTATTTFAVAPDSLEGYIYYEQGNYAGAFPTFELSASVFAADGTFQQLYSRFNPADRGPTSNGCAGFQGGCCCARARASRA